MWRITVTRTITRLGPPAFGLLPWTMYDTKVDVPYDPNDKPIKSTETGMERLKNVFRINEYGGMSKELLIALQAGYFGSFIGLMYGGYFSGVDSYRRYMRDNTETIFRNHIEAKRLLQDKVFLSFARGGVSWGWRMGLFTFGLVFVSNCVSAFRGTNSIIEYTCGGFVAGMIYRANLGLVASLVCGVLGGVLGTVAGIAIWCLLKITGEDVEDIYGALSRLAATRHQKRQELMEHYAEEKESALEEKHESMVGANRDLTKLNEPLPEDKNITTQLVKIEKTADAVKK